MPGPRPVGAHRVGWWVHGAAVEAAATTGPTRAHQAKRQVRARSRGVCEAAAKVCTGTAVYFHHRKMRSAGGSHSAVNGLDVCLPCHDWIHGHPEASYERGLLLHSWENEGREVTG